MRVSQLSIDTLRRSIHLASQSINDALAAQARSSTSAPQAAHQPLIRQPTSLLQQQQQHGIVIRNRCPIDLLGRQVGTDECVKLPAHTSLPYCWHTPPGMTPPGITPPGITPPGITPSGAAPPGMIPPGMTPSSVDPPDITSPAARLLCIASVLPSNAGLRPAPPPEPPVPEFKTASALPLQSSPHSPAVLEPKDERVAIQRPSKETHHMAAAATPLKPRPREFDGKFDSSKTAGWKSGLGTESALDTGLRSGLGSGWESDLGAGAGQDTHLMQTVSAMSWSDGVDCMSSHSCQLRLQLGDGRACTVAVSVHKLGLQWQVVLQPSFVLLNKAAAAVHLHYTGELTTCKGRPAGVSVGAERERRLSQPAPEAGSSFVLEPEPQVGD